MNSNSISNLGKLSLKFLCLSFFLLTFSSCDPVDDDSLLRAALDGNVEEIKSLAEEEGFDVNKRNSHDDRTALMIAAQHGQKEAVKALIELEADVNLKDEEGLTALTLIGRKTILVTIDTRVEIAQILVEAGADVNVVDNEGNTVLMLFAYNKKLVQFFISKGVSITATNKAGETALMEASARLENRCS